MVEVSNYQLTKTTTPIIEHRIMNSYLYT